VSSQDDSLTERPQAFSPSHPPIAATEGPSPAVSDIAVQEEAPSAGARWFGRLTGVFSLLIWPLLLIAFFISSCSEDTPDEEPLSKMLAAKPVTRLTSYHFEGLVLPGTQHDAKALGFTDCMQSSAVFDCKRTRLTRIFGMNALSASLVLDNVDNFAETRFLVRTENQEQLSYRGIQIEFGRTFYHPECIEKTVKAQGLPVWSKPIQCRKNDGIDYLESKLQADGWVNDYSGRGRSNSYYKRGIPLEIEIGSIHGTATLRPFPLADIDFIVQMHSQDAAQAAAKDKARESFFQSMKQTAEQPDKK